MGPPVLDSANGIRTRVPALRGLCPGPLDDSAILGADRADEKVGFRDAFSLVLDRLVRPIARSRPGRNRTCNPRFWRPVLYQLSYGPTALWSQRRSHAFPGWLTGLEPATSGATVRRSNRLSYNHHGGFVPPFCEPAILASRARPGQVESHANPVSARNLPLGPPIDRNCTGVKSFALNYRSGAAGLRAKFVSRYRLGY